MGSIQIRNVPAALHRKLKLRAADRSMSLSEYLLAEIARVGVPEGGELKERLRRRPPLNIPLGHTPAEIVRRMRDEG